MNFSAERAGNAMVVNAMFQGGARDEENLVSCALALRLRDRSRGEGVGSGQTKQTQCMVSLA